MYAIEFIINIIFIFYSTLDLIYFSYYQSIRIPVNSLGLSSGINNTFWLFRLLDGPKRYIYILSDKRGRPPVNRGSELNTEQQEALVGLILGDGYLERAKPTYNARLVIDQTYPKKEEYVNSLFELFRLLISSNVKKILRFYKWNLIKKTRKSYSSIRFKTLVNPNLNKYHGLFFK